MIWFCLCPHCHSELNIPEGTKFNFGTIHICPKCKRKFRSIHLRGLCELIDESEYRWGRCHICGTYEYLNPQNHCYPCWQERRGK